MVAPHPDLLKKIENTSYIIENEMENLLPDLVQQYSNEYISQDIYNKLIMIKPWIEPVGDGVLNINKSEKGLISSKVKTLSPTVYDKMLVVCVDFPDKPALISTSVIRDRFFSTTALNGKTVTNYYKENSYEKFVPVGDVIGWLRAPNNLSYYAGNSYGLGQYPNNMRKLGEDVISLLRNMNIYWNYYDVNGNSLIEYLIIVHAGPDAAYTGNVNDLWSCVRYDGSYYIDTKRIDYICYVSEYMGKSTDQQRIGVDCHEIGHLFITEMGLGYCVLPDLYDYSSATYGVGNYSLMGYGVWIDNGITPVHLDAFCKYLLGWVNPIEVQGNYLVLKDIETYNEFFYCRAYDGTLVNNYYFLENRQAKGFDMYLPATGLLIWNNHFSMATYCLTGKAFCNNIVEQADGLYHLNNKINLGDSGDSYPGSTKNQSFGQYTTPSAITCRDKKYSKFELTNIVEINDVIIANVSSPYLMRKKPFCGVLGNEVDKTGLTPLGTYVCLRDTIYNEDIPGILGEWFTVETGGAGYIVAYTKYGDTMYDPVLAKDKFFLYITYDCTPLTCKLDIS